MGRCFIRLVALLVAAVALARPAAAQSSSGPFVVFFDSGSTTLSEQARDELDSAVTAYRAIKENKPSVMIAGHTDPTVGEDDAVRQSQERANNVRDYLASKGVAASALVTEAFGATRPLAESFDGEEIAENHRVEVTFGPGSGW